MRPLSHSRRPCHWFQKQHFVSHSSHLPTDFHAPTIFHNIHLTQLPCSSKNSSGCSSNFTFFMNPHWFLQTHDFFLRWSRGEAIFNPRAVGIVVFMFHFKSTSLIAQQSTCSSVGRTPHLLSVSSALFSAGTPLYKCLLRNYCILETLRFLQL